MAKVKMPPSNVEAEEVLIGSLIYSQESYDDIAKYINEEVFYNSDCKNLWNIIKKMKRNGEVIDLVTVCDRARGVDIDPYYITGLTEDVVTDTTAISYAKTIYEKFLMRRMIGHTSKIQDSIYNNNVNVYDVLNLTHNVIGNMLEDNPDRGFDISSELSSAVESIKEGGNNLIGTGYKLIDDFGGGMTRGEITILGGRPGHCKTTLMLNIIKNVVNKGYKVIVFNREMTNVEMLKKLIALESGKISYGMLRKGIYDLSMLEEIEQVKKKIERIYTPDKFIMFDNINDFTKGSAEIKKFKPDIIFDDYVQLIKPERDIEQRRLQIEDIVHSYKWLAKSLKCVVFLVSQLNRMMESRGDNRPRLSDIAESGSIEQVAENVLFVYYDYKINLNRSKLGMNVLEVVGSKVRYGNSGAVKLGYEGDIVKIYQSPEELKSEREKRYE